MGAADRTATQRGPLGHVPALDGLRGVAVLLVLYHHVATVLVPGHATLTASGPLDGGFLGVDVFFVLSGFLITSVLLGERRSFGRTDLVGFYLRRGLRLLPALYTLLAVHLVYAWVAGLPLDPTRVAVRDGLMYLSNWSWRWAGPGGSPDLGHLWSLAIEEQFYLAWPLVLLGFAALRRPDSGGAVTAAAVVGVAAWRWSLWHDGEPALLLYLRTDTRIDALLMGALLAQLWPRLRMPARALSAAAWSSSVVLGLAVWRISSTDPRLARGGYTVIALCAAIVVAGAVGGSWSAGGLLRARPLRLLGRVSYGVYLWHLPVFVVMSRHGEGLGWELRVACATLVTAACTAASWFAVERPALLLKARLADRSARRAPVADAPTPALAVPSGTASPAVHLGVDGITSVIDLTHPSVLDVPDIGSARSPSRPALRPGEPTAAPH